MHRLCTQISQDLWSCRTEASSKTMACKAKHSVTKNKALFCTLTQNTRQTFQFLPCQHRKKRGRWKKETREGDSICQNLTKTARNLNGRIKIKLKKSFFFFPQELVMFTLWEFSTLGSMLLTNASKRSGSSHLKKMTPWPASVSTSIEDMPFQVCSKAWGPAKPWGMLTDCSS